MFDGDFDQEEGGREKSVAKSKVCEAWIVHSVDPKLSTGSSLFEMHSVEHVAR
jgi:hypothetical protein